MISIIEKLLKIYDSRDNKNPFFKLNISPTNILVLENPHYNIKFINVLIKKRKEIIANATPEGVNSTLSIDNKKEVVYNLGKLFFYMIFHYYKPSFTSEHLIYLDNYVERLKNRDSELPVIVHTNLITLVRQMLNNFPIDRISLEDALKELKEIQSKPEYRFDSLKDKINKAFYVFKNEVRQEEFNVIYREKINRLKAHENEEKLDKETIHQALKTLDGLFTKNIFNDYGLDNKLAIKIDIGSEDLLEHQKTAKEIKKDRILKIKRLSAYLEKLKQEENFEIDLKLPTYITKKTDFMFVNDVIENEYLAIMAELLNVKGIESNKHVVIVKKQIVEIELKIIIMFCLLISIFGLFSTFLLDYKVDRYKAKDFLTYLDI